MQLNKIVIIFALNYVSKAIFVRLFMSKWYKMLLCCLFLALNGYAQDPQFSQFYANQILVNPAFAGSASYRAALNYRMQWVGIPSSYRTFAAGYDQNIGFGGTNMGLGGVIMTDVAGEGNLATLRANLVYAYELPLGDFSGLRLGLGAGLMQTSLDIHRLRFPNQLDEVRGFDPSRPSGEPANVPSRINEYISAGAVFYNRFLYFGGSVDHLTQPQQRFISNVVSENAKLPMKIQGIAGAMIPLDGETGEDVRIAVSPAVLYRVQGPFKQLDLGIYGLFEPLVVGLWYRQRSEGAFGESIIGLVGCKVGNFRFGYSYDFTVSKLTNANSAGSHEISIVLEWGRERERSKKQLPCPRF